MGTGMWIWMLIDWVKGRLSGKDKITWWIIIEILFLLVFIPLVILSTVREIWMPIKNSDNDTIMWMIIMLAAMYLFMVLMVLISAAINRFKRRPKRKRESGG